MDLNLYKEINAQTQANYNILASHFSYTRGVVWPEIKAFAEKIPPGAKVLDLGCGNGRLYQFLKDKKINYLGLDFSQNLIAEAQKRHPRAQFRVADITQESIWSKLPNQFDFVFCVATLHHLVSEKERKFIVKNIKNSLKNKGQVFATVWNLWQPKYAKYHFSPASLRLKMQLKELKPLYIPYFLNQGRGDLKIINRFLYPFTLSEFKKLFRKDFNIQTAYSSGQNLCLAAQKQI